jgi:hypothetical protein
MIQSTQKRSRPVYRILAIVAVVLVALLIAYISLSDGIDYVHGFGKTCLFIHDGWHIHMRCGSVSPPKS